MPGTPTSVTSCGSRSRRTRVSASESSATWSSRPTSSVSGSCSTSTPKRAFGSIASHAGTGSAFPFASTVRAAPYSIACAVARYVVSPTSTPFTGAADELLHCAAVSLELVPQPGVIRGERRTDVLGIPALGLGGRADEVGEEDRHDLPLLEQHVAGAHERSAAAGAESSAFRALAPAHRADDHAVITVESSRSPPGRSTRATPALRNSSLPMTLLADVVAASNEVGGTSSRSRKVAILAELLTTLEASEVPVAVGFLSGVPRQGRVGVGNSTIYGIERAPAAQPSLSVDDLDRTIAEVQAATGSGSAARRRELLGELLGRATEEEAAFVKRLFTGDLRQGALAGLMADAVAKAAGVSAEVARHALMLSGEEPL